VTFSIGLLLDITVVVSPVDREHSPTGERCQASEIRVSRELSPRFMEETVIGPRKLTLVVLAFSLAAFCPSSLWANTVYISQNGGTFSGGTACNGQATLPISFVNTSSNWVSGNPSGNQIGPGTTVYLCGTFSGSAKASFITAQGSGTSGSPILFQADSNTDITSPAWSVVFNLSGRSYITVDGNSKNGVIENTNNGSSDNYANQVGTVVFGTNSSSHITISNWRISNIYVHDSVSDTFPANPYPCGICDNGASSYLTLHDNIWHDMNFQNSAIADHLVEYNDEVYHVNHGIGGGDANSTNILIHDNNYHDFQNWDTTSNNYHIDPIHFFAQNASGMSGVYVWNNYIHGDLGAHANACIYLESNGNNPGINNFYAFNNVCLTTNSSGFGSGCWGMGNQNTSHTFFNNTCVSPSSSSYAHWITGGAAYLAENNLFNCNDAQCMQVGPQYGSLSNVTFDYNDWYSTAGQQFCYGLTNEPCYSSFASYRSASGQDGHSIAANPQLNSDGSETSNSPTIAAGANLSSLCTGLGLAGNPCMSDSSLGNTRTPIARPNSGAWDIGALQYDASNPPNPPTNLNAVIH